MEHLRPFPDGRGVDGVDVLARLDDERHVMEAGRIEEELLLVQRLAQAERSRACGREAQVVDLLAALAVYRNGSVNPSGPKTAA